MRFGGACSNEQFIEATVNAILGEWRDLWPGGMEERAYQTLSLMAQCRTGGLGYNYGVCSSCRRVEWFGSSCGDRHCPNCLGARQARWSRKVCERLPDCAHFHVVFTVPSELHEFFECNYGLAAQLLFESAAQTLKKFQRRNWKMKQGGFLGVLHTWGSSLNWHPHLHVLVSAGGADVESGRWKEASERYLFAVKALSKVYRGIFLEKLEELESDGEVDWPEELGTVEARRDWRLRLAGRSWNIYSRPTLRKTRAVVRYLARYTSRIAISNQRVKEVDEHARTVTFDWKDYRSGGRRKEMTLDGAQFIRRFSRHLVPKGLRRVRSYGFLSGGGHWTTIKGSPSRSVGERSPTHARPACRHCGAQHWHYVICYGSTLEEAPGLEMALRFDPTYCGSEQQSCSLPSSRAGPEGG